MWFCLLQVLRPDVDDVAADCLGRVECQIQVFRDFEGGHVVAHVDRPLVNRIRHSHVHQFTAKSERKGMGMIGIRQKPRNMVKLKSIIAMRHSSFPFIHSFIPFIHSFIYSFIHSEK